MRTRTGKSAGLPTYCVGCGGKTPCDDSEHHLDTYQQVTIKEMLRYPNRPTLLLPTQRMEWEKSHRELMEQHIEHTPPAEEIDLCELEPCPECKRPMPPHREGSGLETCYWCNEWESDPDECFCSAGPCLTLVSGRSHPYCEECQKHYTTQGCSSEAASVDSARTSSPGRPGERPTLYCARCGGETPCGRKETHGITRGLHHTRWVQLPASEFDAGWPTDMTPKNRAAWHAEHNPEHAKPSDHELDHVSIRGPADYQTPSRPTPGFECLCGQTTDPDALHGTTWSCDSDECRRLWLLQHKQKPDDPGCPHPRPYGRILCDACLGRVTTVDPYNLTQWPPPPVEDEPEERVNGCLPSEQDRIAINIERWRKERPIRDSISQLAAIDSRDLDAVRREYTRLGELLRGLEGES